MRVPPERAAALATTLKTMIPSAQRPQIEVISDRINLALRPWRLATLLFMTLGGVALALACVGVYSVMSYIASERIHELGVRIVLGAQAGDIVRLVLGGGLRLVATGAVLGLIGGGAQCAVVVVAVVRRVAARCDGLFGRGGDSRGDWNCRDACSGAQSDEDGSDHSAEK